MADVNASLAKALDGTAPQYKRAGEDAFDPVEGSGGSLHTKIYGDNDEAVNPSNPLSVNLAKNSIEIDSESDLELKAGESYTSPFKKARGNKVSITLTSGDLDVTKNIEVVVAHFNTSTSGYLYSEYLVPVRKYPRNITGTGRTFETELVGKYYQIKIKNTTSIDSVLNRLYIKESINSVNKELSTEVSPRQIMERGSKVYGESSIGFGSRDVIFETNEPFVLDHFYYLYEPRDREDESGLNNNHSFLVSVKVGDEWVPYTGVATNNSGRMDPTPEAISSQVYNAHLPQYNILQFDTKNAVYAFELNKEIIAPEGLQLSVYSPNGLEEGGKSYFSYQIRGRITND